MLESEKVLISNNWDLQETIKQIKYEKWTLEDYTYKHNSFIAFKGYFDFERAKKDSIIFIIIIIIFFTLILSMPYFINLPNW